MLLAQAAGTALNSPIREEWIWLIAVIGPFSVVIIAIVAGVIRSSVRTRAKEQSRREIAAYVAEGSISPTDAERLLDAGMPRWERPCKS